MALANAETEKNIKLFPSKINTKEEKKIHMKSKSSSMISHHSCSSKLERQQEVMCRKNFGKLKKYKRFAKTYSQQKEKVQKNTDDLRRTELRVTVKYLGSQ